MLYRFSDLILDTRRRELRRGQQLVAVEPQVFDLLQFLIQSRERVVSRDDMLAAVWQGRIVSEATLSSRVNSARAAIGDNGEEQRLIRTLPRKGMRFVGVVREEPDVPVDPADEAASENAHPRIAGLATPSIAVLPFSNMSGDAEQEYFADGMVEEITTALSRIRWLFVIARNSSFTYKGQTIDVKRVGRELGVRYVLEGSVRKAGGRVRITGQLIDAASGTHLWADRFDGSLNDVFDLQDQVATNVAGVIEPTLEAAEMARVARRPTNDLTAYDLYLRAHALVWSSTKEIPEALRLLEQAIARDAKYGPALAWAAVCHAMLGDLESENHPTESRSKGVELARRALEVAGDDPGVLANAALALARFGEDIGAAVALVDRALALNPSYARGWNISGVLRNWAGEPDTAIKHVETALRLSPRARVGTSSLNMGASHFLSRRFTEAVPKLRLAIQEDPCNPQPYRYLAASYAHMKQLDQAREVVTQLRTVTSVVIPVALYIRKADHRELFLSGLRLAACKRPDCWIRSSG